MTSAKSTLRNTTIDRAQLNAGSMSSKTLVLPRESRHFCIVSVLWGNFREQGSKKRGSANHRKIKREKKSIPLFKAHCLTYGQQIQVCFDCICWGWGMCLERTYCITCPSWSMTYCSILLLFFLHGKVLHGVKTACTFWSSKEKPKNMQKAEKMKRQLR